jgi:hypothetical protein
VEFEEMRDYAVNGIIYRREIVEKKCELKRAAEDLVALGCDTVSTGKYLKAFRVDVMLPYSGIS